MSASVLLVEDEELLRESYQIILEAEAYRVDTASNGLEALAHYLTQTYDIVLLDIMMPEMDGIGFLKNLAEVEGIVWPKIIVLSNLSANDQINQALELGAAQYVQKSQLDPAGLVTMLREQLATI
jgi:DNA-binding response OmpR family regulator